MNNEALQVIANRKSVRSFKAVHIDEKTIEMILKAGMAAPSAMDCRPWKFIIIDEPGLLKDIGTHLQNSAYTKEASCAIVVLGDLKVQHGGKDAQFWVIDCSAATQNILLAIESLGLGAVWTAVYPDMASISYLRTLLNIPAHMVPLNVIPIGTAGETTEPKDKFDEAVIYRNKM